MIMESRFQQNKKPFFIFSVKVIHSQISLVVVMIRYYNYIISEISNVIIISQDMK